jgi:hypothetical protein
MNAVATAARVLIPRRFGDKPRRRKHDQPRKDCGRRPSKRSRCSGARIWAKQSRSEPGRLGGVCDLYLPPRATPTALALCRRSEQAIGRRSRFCFGRVAGGPTLGAATKAKPPLTASHLMHQDHGRKCAMNRLAGPLRPIYVPFAHRLRPICVPETPAPPRGPLFHAPAHPQFAGSNGP